MTFEVILNDVSFSYGATRVFEDFNLSIPKNKLTFLLGPNGAGKTTLFNLITGLSTAQAGTVTVGGSLLPQDRISIAKRMGIVFQSPTVDRELTVLQNLHYFAGLHGLRGYEKHLETLLDQFELAQFAKSPLERLSGGYKRRVEVVRALLNKPDFLILDEPTVGIDPASKQMITDLVHDLPKEGITVFWITHMLDELREGDGYLFLKDGKVRDKGDFDTQKTVAHLRGLYTPQRAKL